MTLQGDPNLTDHRMDQPFQHPLHMLRHWLAEATRVQVNEPNGIVLATVDVNGLPSTRVVLQKSVDELGIVFSSSGRSKKGLDLQRTPLASCTYWWRETMQQVHCIGHVVQLGSEVSDALFEGRNPSAQAISHLSHQSQPLLDEGKMREQVNAFIQNHASIKRPDHWHAYRLEPVSIEFWLGSPDRFHRRIHYQRSPGKKNWEMQHLQP